MVSLGQRQEPITGVLGGKKIPKGGLTCRQAAWAGNRQVKGTLTYTPLRSLQQARPRSVSPAPLPYLQVTIFRGGGFQVGVIGLVQQLCEQSPRELLGCEWVLEDRGAHRLVPGHCSPAPSPPPQPLPPTCRSFSAVGLFLGFLVKASLRKWWKFWVLVGTRAPHPRPRLALRRASCQLPPATTAEAHPGRSQSGAEGSWLEQYRCCDMAARPSSPSALLPRPHQVPPADELWGPREGRAPPPPRDLAARGPQQGDVGAHQRVLSLSLGGWKLLLDMSIKALWRAQGQGSRVSRTLGVRRGASVQLTSWGAGGTEGAAARPARWQ